MKRQGTVPTIRTKTEDMKIKGTNQNHQLLGLETKINIKLNETPKITEKNKYPYH